MKLQNNLVTETGWEILERSFDQDQVVTTGSNFMIGNGYLGYRGTLAEWGADQFVACIVTDTYDMADEQWRELCNVPNGLFTQLLVDGEPLSIFDGRTGEYQRGLDLRQGLFFRNQGWQGNGGIGLSLGSEKFASYENVHLLVMRYQFQVEGRAEVTLITGIDGRVWSMHGEHFKEYHLMQENDRIAIETITGEAEIQIDVVEGIDIQGNQPAAAEIITEEKRILRCLTFNLQTGEQVVLDKVVAIYHSNDLDDPRQAAHEAVRSGLKTGYQRLKEQNQEVWERIWEESDIQIEGHLEDQTITRFNLYQNTIATPTHARLPIGARGLSCQVYQGAAFWDQEIFNLPMYIYSRPEIARNILEYRHATLDGARKKARDLGYYGAFYAWTSGKTGEELFPDYFFTDVLTGRKIRNHFNDWQIHISPDIVYALWVYYQATQDWEFIVHYGAEIAFEVAQFLVAHTYFKKDKGRFEFIRLLGPDEYHENVDNNAFTNYQAQFALANAVEIYHQMEERAPEDLQELSQKIGIEPQDLANWQEMVEHIYLPQPDEENLLIEQFDGFFKLEDILPEELKKRLKDPNEYWGWPNGIAVGAQVLKQADILQLLALHDIFPTEVVRANYDYYEPRTEHGSSLSPSVHSLIASKAGYREKAYRYFREGSTIDLYEASKKVVSGGAFLGGIHTAACGAVWQMIVFGFAGFSPSQGGIRFQPAIPRVWKSVGFKLRYWSNTLEITITSDQLMVRSNDQNPDSLSIQVGEQMKEIAPGQKQSFAIR